MTKFPELKTKRLILREISYKDIPKIVEYAGNAKIAETTLNIPHPYQEKDAIFWINNANQGFSNQTQYTFGIRLKSTGEFIGGVGLKVNKRFNRSELGYWMAEDFWNKGYVTEAVGAILAFNID